MNGRFIPNYSLPWPESHTDTNGIVHPEPGSMDSLVALTPHDRMRAFKRMAQNMATLLPTLPDAEDGLKRASGQAVCDKCGLMLSDHPMVGPNEARMTVGCDGNLYHL